MSEPFITTFTGRRVNPLHVKIDDVCIEDIAHALACCNRFAGHTRRPISVAQHSVYVSRLCENKGKAEALQGLLHDASEAYLGDVTKWLKESNAFTAYREAEEIAQIAIFQKFGCSPIQAPVVDWADTLIVRYEGYRSYPKGFDFGGNPRYPPCSLLETELVGSWQPWNWRMAEEVFLSTARLLGVNC